MQVSARTNESSSQQDGWFREVVDPAVRSRPVSMSVRDGLISIAVTPERSRERATTFVSDGKRWEERVLHEGAPILASTWDAKAVPWLLLDANQGIAVKRGPDGAAEVLTSGHVFAHDIAAGPDGVPHVCLSLDKEESAKEFVYATRSKSKTGPSGWQQERIPMAIGACRIVATEDDIHIIVTNAMGVSAWSKIDGGSWKTEKLSSDPLASIAATRTPSGLGVVAFSENQSVQLMKFSNELGTRSEIALGLPSGSVRALALTIDRSDVVHVAFRVGHGTADGEVMYASERAPAAMLVARDQTERIALQLDDTNAPHLAYVATWPDERNLHLIHARIRTPAERDLPSGTYHQDESTLLQSCATLVTGQIGEAHGHREHQRADRWCGPNANPSWPTKERLGSLCVAGDINACLLEGTRAGKLKVLLSAELARDVCATGKQKDRCFASFKNKEPLAGWLDRGSDDSSAMKRFEKACALGSKAACMLFAFDGSNTRDARIDLFASACGPEFPIACAALLIEVNEKPDSAKAVLPPVRSSLTKACTSSEKPEACNALAYMEEAGLGGAVRVADAVRHHVRACDLGSVLSCVRLLTGPFGRQRPPRKLDPEKFEDHLSNRCSARDEVACIALATAFETGWGVERDRNKARAVLDEACQEGLAGACKRAKRAKR